MAEASTVSKRSQWDIPPPDQSGNVPWLAKTTAKLFLKSQGMWAARPARPREKELIDILNETCREMGISNIPRLFIYDSYKPNAVATLIGDNILFSTNLLDIMQHDQVKAIMGHELTHHSRQKPKSIAVLLSTGIIADIAANRAFHSLRNQTAKNPATRLLQSAARVPFLGEVIREIANFSMFLASYGWFQRRFESQADLGGAKVAGEKAMVEALETMDARFKEIRRQEAKEGKIDWKKYTLDLPIFRTHPTIPKRIENILANGPRNLTEHSATVETSRRK